MLNSQEGLKSKFISLKIWQRESPNCIQFVLRHTSPWHYGTWHAITSEFRFSTVVVLDLAQIINKHKAGGNGIYS